MDTKRIQQRSVNAATSPEHLNADVEIATCVPGSIVTGGEGCGELVVFDGTGAVFTAPDCAIRIAENFQERDRVALQPATNEPAHLSHTWRMSMPTKSIDGHEVEFTGELLEGTEQWGAFVSISVPSDNPMHMKNIYPKRRVSIDLTFADHQAAEAEAERAASNILKELHS